MSGIPSASCGSARAHLLPNSHEKEEFPPVSPAGGHKPDPEVAFPSFSQPALQLPSTATAKAQGAAFSKA